MSSYLDIHLKLSNGDIDRLSSIKKHVIIFLKWGDGIVIEDKAKQYPSRLV